MGVEIIHIYDRPDDQFGNVIISNSSIPKESVIDPSNIRNDVERRIEERIPDIKKKEDPFDNPFMWKKSS